jgi:ABC-type transporter MlaC component
VRTSFRGPLQPRKAIAMRKTIAALSLSLALLMPTLALAEGGAGAIDAFKQSHQEVTALVDAGADASKIQLMVDGMLDYDFLTKAALGGPKRYAEACGDRCDEFKALLTKLIRENYLKRIKAKNRGTVEYQGEEVREKATKVDTKVTFVDKDGKTQVVEIDYVMHKVDGKWQVRDIITEGVSLAKNYKYEINRLYVEGGMDKVITTLQKKLDEVSKSD